MALGQQQPCNHQEPCMRRPCRVILCGGPISTSVCTPVSLQERREASDGRPCPSCGGSGLQPCFCTKWSDGDVGCSSCSSSGWTKCKSCGGGGMAVPIKVSIRK